MTRYKCPDNARHANDIVGCGCEFDATPEDDGTVDCPECGIWFTPALEVAEQGQPKAPTPAP